MILSPAGESAQPVFPRQRDPVSDHGAAFFGYRFQRGKLGKEFTKEEGVEYSRNAMLNVLAVLEAEIGDLNKVKQPVKILTFVASEDSFDCQPFVANGGSQLLVDLFGAENAPSRSAIGVNVLPGNIPVETEAIFELKEE